MKKVAVLWDICKLERLIAVSCLYTSIARSNYKQKRLLPVWYILTFCKMFWRINRYIIGSHRREFIHTKHIVFNGHTLETMSHIFWGLLLVAWLCERMKVNLKIEGLSDLFSDDLIINNASEYSEDYFKNTKEFNAGAMLWLAICYIRSEYGYKILSKFPIREDIRKCADEWFTNHIKGDWVAVHFRGTDCKDMKTQYKNRFRIKLDDYINYLKAVLDKKCSILVCSDQAQFIDEMRDTFPGRVFARDIQRSYDNRALHIDPEYRGVKQKKDALIDMLILAKANLVYTSGSGLIDVLRFLNPSIKIVSLDERWLGKRFSINRNSSHGAPIPRNDLLKKFRKSYL